MRSRFCRAIFFLWRCMIMNQRALHSPDTREPLRKLNRFIERIENFLGNFKVHTLAQVIRLFKKSTKMREFKQREKVLLTHLSECVDFEVTQKVFYTFK